MGAVDAFVALAKLFGLDVRDLINETGKVTDQISRQALEKHRKAQARFSTPTRVSSALRHYYGAHSPKENYSPYSILVENTLVQTSILISKSGLMQDYPIDGSPYKLANTFRPPMQIDAILGMLSDSQKSAIASSTKIMMARHEKLGTRLWNDPLYRLVDCAADRDIEFVFSQCDYLAYRWTWGLLEDEAKDLLAQDKGEVHNFTPHMGHLPVRDILLPSIDSILTLDKRLCCGGVEVTTAFLTEDSFVIPLQTRSHTVSDGQGLLATIPKGWHQPISGAEQNVQPYWTVLREYFEELFDGDVQRKEKRLNCDWWLAEENAYPILYLVENPGKVEFHGLGFGFNMMAGNFEFFILMVVKDMSYLQNFTHLAGWESDDIHIIKTTETAKILELLKGNHAALVNECVPSFCRALFKLYEIDPSRVRLPELSEHCV